MHTTLDVHHHLHCIFTFYILCHCKSSILCLCIPSTDIKADAKTLHYCSSSSDNAEHLVIVFSKAHSPLPLSPA